MALAPKKQSKLISPRLNSLMEKTQKQRTIDDSERSKRAMKY